MRRKYPLEMPAWFFQSGGGGMTFPYQNYALSDNFPQAKLQPNGAFSNAVISGGGLVLTNGAALNTNQYVKGDTSILGGKIYFEMTATTAQTTSSRIWAGLCDSTYVFGNNSPGGDNHSCVIYCNESSNQVKINGSSTQFDATHLTQGAVYGFAVDLVNAKMWGRTNNGNWNNGAIGSQNPATNTGGVSIAGLVGSVPNATPVQLWVMAGDFSNGAAADTVLTLNFGESLFANPAPSGFNN